jgi:hypothetical protein
MEDGRYNKSPEINDGRTGTEAGQQPLRRLACGELEVQRDDNDQHLHVPLAGVPDL